MSTVPTKETARLRVDDLCKTYPGRATILGAHTYARPAVDSVSFEIAGGETLSLVGESGCGKSTTGRMVVLLMRPSAGSITYKGTDLTHADGKELRNARRSMQMVFQDPQSSLSPRLSAFEIVAEPLRIQRTPKADIPARVYEVLDLLGLPRQAAQRYSYEFSGGQKQRLGIARALVLRPDVLVLDEPVSSLDVSIQAQVLNELHKLQRELGLSYLFISHDLSVVQYVSDRVAVMYLGRIVELGRRDAIFEQPLHPYTQALLSANPIVDPQLREQRPRIILRGEIPSADTPIEGCPFRARCWKAREKCSLETPLLEPRGRSGHKAACHFPGD